MTSRSETWLGINEIFQLQLIDTEVCMCEDIAFYKHFHINLPAMLPNTFLPKKS